MREPFSKIRPLQPGDVRIQIDSAWLRFPIFDAKSRSLDKTFLVKAGATLRRGASNERVVEAFKDISLSLRTGDRVGLVGHNGAGKSTLLRLVSGIYEPTRGSDTARGRVAPIFDLGLGMNPEISGYENIIIRGLFLGEGRRSMLSKVDDIAEFTELGRYLSMPLRAYSTGMRVRRVIGVLASIDPEILLLDEAIGALDREFLERAQVKLDDDLVERCGIPVVAAHSGEFLTRVCKTGIWLDHETIQLTGRIDEVVRADAGAGDVRHVAEIVR